MNNEEIKASEEEAVIEKSEEMTPSEASPVTIILDDETKRLLDVRRKQKGKKPTFLQTDSHKKKKLKDYWRKPDGIHNKTRYALHGKCSLVEAGYGSPAAVRGLHPSGFEEVMLNSIRGLEGLETKRQAGRIAGNVGKRKRNLIEKRAHELGLKILNPTRKVD